MSGATSGYFTRDHGDHPVILRTADDADAFVDAMLREKPTNSVAALYAEDRPLKSDLPDHELRIAVNVEAKLGGIRYAGGALGNTCYVSGVVSERDEVFYYYMGHDEGWPTDSEVSIGQVRQAVREFVKGSGARPTGFEWTEWPEGVR